MEEILQEHCRALEERIDNGLNVTKQDVRELQSSLSELSTKFDEKHLRWQHNLIISAIIFFFASGLALYLSIRSDALDRVDASVNQKLNNEISLRENKLSKSLSDEEKRVRAAQETIDEARAQLSNIKESAKQMRYEMLKIQEDLEGTDLLKYKLVKEQIEIFTASVDALADKVSKDPFFANTVLSKAGRLEEGAIVVFHRDECPSDSWVKSDLNSSFGDGTVVCEKVTNLANTAGASANE